MQNSDDDWRLDHRLAPDTSSPRPGASVGTSHGKIIPGKTSRTLFSSALTKTRPLSERTNACATAFGMSTDEEEPVCCPEKPKADSLHECRSCFEKALASELADAFL